ncbi:MAG: TolC family protein [Desulfuromusa sp.]|jgi:cobalt-zinc-cadmium efflux system outer membrane protein|nr:TolC family protein [Desulfuromusa sp.]
MSNLTRKKYLLIALCLLFSPPAFAASPFLQQLLDDADQKNPLLIVAQEQISVAESKIDQVTSLNDPVLSISFLNYPSDQIKSDITPMTGNEVRLSQLFPFPGKLDAKGKSAAHKSRWFDLVYQDTRLQVRQKVKDAWFRLLFLRQAIELTNRNLKLLEDFIKLTETRYQVGMGLQQNVLKAHLQRSKQLDKLISLQLQEDVTSAELNSLAGRLTSQPLDVDETLSEISFQYSLHDLQQQAEQSRPMFAAFDALTEQYRAEKELAKLNYRPDFTLWAGYRWRDDALNDGGTDFVSAGVSFNLPVRRARRSAAVAEADSSLRMVYQKRSDFLNIVSLEIHRSLANLEQASRQVELYKNGIIPQANQTFQATLSAYQVDKVDFLDLLDSLMTLYRYEIDSLQAISGQHRSLARVEAASGLNADQLITQSGKHKGTL